LVQAAAAVLVAVMLVLVVAELAVAA